MPHSRDEILALLHGKPIQRHPVFSGLPSLTASGLAAARIRYSEAHTDPVKMAAAAASTFETSGFESAVVPFDLCVEAEALGCHVDFQTDVDVFLPPVVDVPLTWGKWQARFAESQSLAGRIPIITGAIRQLKEGVGREIAIGACMPGPFTLAWQLFGADAWLSATSNRDKAIELLGRAAHFLSLVANSYTRAGADFITVHEMGGSPQAIGTGMFRALVKPMLVKLFADLPTPNVLSICGDTNTIIRDLAECGANALSFDQRNDIARTRQALPHAILLGNLDPVGTLSQGTPEAVRLAAQNAMTAGVNAIWPGCDLLPEIPEANIRALISAAASYPLP